MDNEELKLSLKRIINEARAQGIPVPDNISEEIYINPRPKKRFGCCRLKDGEYQIEISAFILECSERAICNVIAHEVIHTCRDSYNHGKKWKEYADRMNAVYGYSIKRTSSFSEMGLDEPDQNSRKIKYIIKCRKCGREYPRTRYTRVIAGINSYRCRCGGRLYVIKV